MRRKLVDADLIDCVLGLGPNLFYNSPMEACVVVCRASKPKARRGRILFINGINEVSRERAQSFLTDGHIERIVDVYRAFRDEPGFTRVASLDEIRSRDGSLSIPLYVAPAAEVTGDEKGDRPDVADALEAWLESSRKARAALERILQ
jgi:type I restriction enzyme M protein